MRIVKKKLEKSGLNTNKRKELVAQMKDLTNGMKGYEDEIKKKQNLLEECKREIESAKMDLDYLLRLKEEMKRRIVFLFPESQNATNEKEKSRGVTSIEKRKEKNVQEERKKKNVPKKKAVRKSNRTLNSESSEEIDCKFEGDVPGAVFDFDEVIDSKCEVCEEFKPIDYKCIVNSKNVDVLNESKVTRFSNEEKGVCKTCFFKYLNKSK